jgi:hypothetical protein
MLVVLMRYGGFYTAKHTIHPIMGFPSTRTVPIKGLDIGHTELIDSNKVRRRI